MSDDDGRKEAAPLQESRARRLATVLNVAEFMSTESLINAAMGNMAAPGLFEAIRSQAEADITKVDDEFEFRRDRFGRVLEVGDFAVYVGTGDSPWCRVIGYTDKQVRVEYVTRWQLERSESPWRPRETARQSNMLIAVPYILGLQPECPGCRQPLFLWQMEGVGNKEWLCTKGCGAMVEFNAELKVLFASKFKEEDSDGDEATKEA